MLMVCSLPPPVNGQTLVNSMLADKFREDRFAFDIHDISPSHHRGLRYHLTRIRRVLAAAGKLLRTSDHSIYLSSEARFGVFYLLFLCFFSHLKGNNIFMHHHVYSYIKNRSLLHFLLMSVAGKRCTHILLSPRMARDFQARFDVGQRCLTLHNAIFVDSTLRREAAVERRGDGGLTLGFIGRLEEAKGFGDYMTLLERLTDDPRFRFLVAGDHENTEYRARIRAMRERLGDRLELLGFVGGDRKRAFFANVDVLVFPSRYVNEASPMVCYEALAMGVPVIATRVGAVDDIVDGSCGVVMEHSDALVDRMAEMARDLRDHPDLLAEWRAAALSRFATLHREGLSEYERLRARLADLDSSKNGCERGR